MLVGLAFNTKTLAALLVVPGLALGYLVCAPGPLRRRLVQLLVAGGVMVAVSGAWIAFVDLTPASQRPYVGSSARNTELNLTFGYNGFGRVNGEVGGPGQVPHVETGSLPPVTAPRVVGRAAAAVRAGASPHATSPTSGPPPRRRAREPAPGCRRRAAARRSPWPPASRRSAGPRPALARGPSSRRASSRSRASGTRASRACSADQPDRCACSASASAGRTAGSCRSHSRACSPPRCCDRGAATRRSRR